MNTKLQSIRTLAMACSALTLATAGHAAITANAITANAITANAITANALANNALTNNGLSPQAAATATPSAPVGAYTPSVSWKMPAIRTSVPAADNR